MVAYKKGKFFFVKYDKDKRDEKQREEREGLKKSFFLDVFPEVIVVTLRVAAVLLSGIHHTRVGGVLGGVLLLAEKLKVHGRYLYVKA